MIETSSYEHNNICTHLFIKLKSVVLRTVDTICYYSVGRIQFRTQDITHTLKKSIHPSNYYKLFTIPF